MRVYFQVREWIETKGIEFALMATYNATKPYTPAWHEQALLGMVSLHRFDLYYFLVHETLFMQAAGGDIPFEWVASVAMIPEVGHVRSDITCASITRCPCRADPSSILQHGRRLGQGNCQRLRWITCATACSRLDH